MPAADSVALLLQRREAWLSLEWSEHVAFKIRRHGGVYDLVGGVLAYLNKNHLEIIRLPNARNGKGHTVRRDLNGTAILCFAMDPTQDLIVLLEDCAR